MRWASQGHPANFRRMVLSRLASKLMVYTVFIRFHMSSRHHVPSCSIIYPTNIAVNIHLFTIEQIIFLSLIILMNHIPPSPHPSQKNATKTTRATAPRCCVPPHPSHPSAPWPSRSSFQRPQPHWRHLVASEAR